MGAVHILSSSHLISSYISAGTDQDVPDMPMIEIGEHVIPTCPVRSPTTTPKRARRMDKGPLMSLEDWVLAPVDEDQYIIYQNSDRLESK